MSARFPSKGDRRKEYANGRRNLPVPNVTQKPLAFDVLKPNLSLSDESEFPSLNETSKKVPHHSHSGEVFSKYSDKLKLHSSPQSSSFINLRSDSDLTDSYKGCNHNSRDSKFQNKLIQRTRHSFNERDRFQTNLQCEPNESNYANKKFVNTSQNTPKCHSNSFRESNSSKSNENKNHSSKQKHSVNSPNSLSHCTYKATVVNSGYSSHSFKSNNQTESNNEQKTVVKSSPVKENNDASSSSATKKKKKRKSKVKRQVALQTGKITVLTPEVHSKILNQSSALTSHNFKSILTDINDEEEYPELGKSLIPSSQKENYPKKETSFSQSIHDAVDKNTDMYADKDYLTKDISVKDSPTVTMSDDPLAVEKKGKTENKAVHTNDPITVSFFDMLVNKNVKTKVKALKIEDDTPPTLGLAKPKIKKNSCHPHNFLDSSAPTVKRGKEREKPKLKKPSHLKKIILLDRKIRKEQLLHLKNNSVEGENAVTGDEYEQINKSEENEIDSTERSIFLDKMCDNNPDTLAFQLELQEENDHFLQLEDCGLCLLDYSEFPSKTEDISVNRTEESDLTLDIVSSVVTPIDDEKLKPFSEEVSINERLDKISINKEVGLVHSEITEDSSHVEKSNTNVSISELLLDSFKNHDEKLNSSDREKAVKILLHTRNFREYCNHLSSKDIDEVVHALLDDLARFQDRLHQKDPVKARMKRRMIYGVKEVKKHIKLKKLKSIIIAADIENVEAQGGLNDFLDDIKSSASDHRIPCVFALNRKVLGKVCHKPVPVSCVGVFNYEGSEANFKKMVELQTQSKIDYIEICNKFLENLAEDQIASLLKAKKEAPEALSTIRRNILEDFFRESKDPIVEQENIDIKSEKTSNSSDTEI